MSDERLYAFVIDNGCEGMSAPFQLVRGKREAWAVLRLMRSAGAHLVEVFEVALWPDTVNGAIYDLKPVADWSDVEPINLGNPGAGSQQVMAGDAR